jgi:hypothetical protein
MMARRTARHAVVGQSNRTRNGLGSAAAQERPAAAPQPSMAAPRVPRDPECLEEREAPALLKVHAAPPVSRSRRAMRALVASISRSTCAMSSDVARCPGNALRSRARPQEGPRGRRVSRAGRLSSAYARPRRAARATSTRPPSRDDEAPPTTAGGSCERRLPCGDASSRPDRIREAQRAGLHAQITNQWRVPEDRADEALDAWRPRPRLAGLPGTTPTGHWTRRGSGSGSGGSVDQLMRRKPARNSGWTFNGTPAEDAARSNEPNA